MFNGIKRLLDSSVVSDERTANSMLSCRIGGEKRKRKKKSKGKREEEMENEKEFLFSVAVSLSVFPSLSLSLSDSVVKPGPLLDLTALINLVLCWK